MNDKNLTEARVRIGLQLLKRRESLGWTQEVLAEKLEISRSTVAKVEKGKWSFSIDYLQRFCEVLNLKIELHEC
ncbi:helix-turn-helix domain-containing protein [Lacihabitans soyangensis]|nr:helix-turn-helix transcriptional regulator [Lacihabitans soyangensis]